MKEIRTPSKYKGKKIKLKETSRTFLELQEEQDESTSIIIEDWAENVFGKTNGFIKDRLSVHLDKSNLARIVDLDELELDECEHRHENGNCLFVGGFCTSVTKEHCIKEHDKDIHNKAIECFEEKLLYQIGDLGIRKIIEETAKQLHR